MTVKLATLDLGPAVWWCKFCTVPIHLTLFVLFAQLQRSFIFCFLTYNFSARWLKYILRKKKFFSQRFAGTFEGPVKACKVPADAAEPLKVLLRTFFCFSQNHFFSESSCNQMYNRIAQTFCLQQLQNQLKANSSCYAYHIPFHVQPNWGLSFIGLPLD